MFRIQFFALRAAVWPLLLSAILVAAVSVSPAAAQDPADWGTQQPLTILNSGGALTDYQVKVVLDATNFDFGLAASGGADLLFTDLDGAVFYPYWIESWDAVAEQAVVWVRLPELPAADSLTIALLSNNPGAAGRSDGSQTFLFYSGFEEMVGTTAMNAPVPLVTPTYDGSGQVVHPDVLHVPGGWNGYEYWMGMTPYPGSNDSYENPSIIASNDNITWVEPAGISNPLAPTPPGHNDDVDMLLVGGQLIMYYNETNSDGNTYMKRLVSSDGVTWSAPQTVITMPNYVMSPAVIHDGTEYVMWYVRSVIGCSAPAQDFYRRTSTDGITWGPEEVATMDHPGRVLWHMDVQLSGGLYTMLFISYPAGSSCGATQLYYAESSDGLAWTATPEPVLVPVAGSWDSANIYRASYTIDGSFLGIWYSARSTSNQWRVGYTEGDLDDFLGSPAAVWDEQVGNVAATTDHPRSGTHGLREIGGSTYPQVFGNLPGSGVCVNVWYYEELSSTTNFMALLRLWDTDDSQWTAHCIGTGIWTGTSTSNYSWHNEGFSYTATGEARAPGWRHLSIAVADGPAELRVDGVPVATTSALTPALIHRFSVEGYRGGTGYFDDAYVRSYVVDEPVALVGESGVVGVEDGWPGETGGLPAAPEVMLEQNVPNPLNPGTVIAFDLPRSQHVTLQVMDLRGRVVRSLLSGWQPEGRREVAWDGRDDRGRPAASGAYLYRLTTPQRTVSRKLMLVK